MKRSEAFILRWGGIVVLVLSLAVLAASVVGTAGLYRASKVDHRTTKAAAESQRIGCAIQSIWFAIAPTTEYEREAQAYYRDHPRDCTGVTTDQTTPK